MRFKSLAVNLYCFYSLGSWLLVVGRSQEVVASGRLVLMLKSIRDTWFGCFLEGLFVNRGFTV